MNPLISSLQYTLRSVRVLSLIYGITLIMGLLVAFPFYNTLIVEDQNSLAFLKLLDGFDYTIYSDFMHRSKRTLTPLMSVGRWLGLAYLFLSVFFAGGILARFTQFSSVRLSDSFTIGAFWQACSYYVARLLGLFAVTLLFVIVGAGLWLVIGTILALILSDTLTERGQFWIGLLFFTLFALTAAFILCIGDYAKVLMIRDDESNAFRAFGRAGRLVLRNPVRTYGLYCLFILIGTGLFGLYFLIDEAIPIRGWLTILIMFIVQQLFIFARVGLKVWWLGTAYGVYERMPKPVFVSQPVSAPSQEMIPDNENPGYTGE
ncbi:hypothetical protein [Spirosoma sp. KNUC1025]|uniref:hypothetical protein n=1 Tax=Spirosoma sp. KNUC1025 TaxID=2894082 RepID=UPI003865E36C|nr:hypothetical protein LN737_26270 [Spirosoma sp. KNUC1025]